MQMFEWLRNFQLYCPVPNPSVELRGVWHSALKDVLFDVILVLPINYEHNYMVCNKVLDDKHDHLQITTFWKLTV